MVVYTFNPSTWDTEVGRSLSSDHSGRQSEFQKDSQDYTIKLCFEKPWGGKKLYICLHSYLSSSQYSKLNSFLAYSWCDPKSWTLFSFFRIWFTSFQRNRSTCLTPLLKSTSITGFMDHMEKHIKDDLILQKASNILPAHKFVMRMILLSPKC